MSDHALTLATIVGSTREGRFGGTVARWFVAQAQPRADMTLDVIDLANLGLPAVYPERPPPPVRAFTDRIAAADAFGEPRDSTQGNGAAKTMLDQFAWWARALRDARAAHPYAA